MGIVKTRKMSFLLMFMGTALIYPQSGAKGLFEITFGTIESSFLVVRVEKGILRTVTLSINKALSFWPFKTIKHLYVLGSFDTKHVKQYISTILYTWHEILLFYIEIVLSLLRSEIFHL